MIEDSFSKNIKGKGENNNEKLNLAIEIAEKNDWEDYKSVRLEAIKNEPLAYGVTKEREEKENNKSDEDWKNELSAPSTFTVLAKNDKIPVGMAQAILNESRGEGWWA